MLSSTGSGKRLRGLLLGSMDAPVMRDLLSSEDVIDEGLSDFSREDLDLLTVVSIGSG